MRRFLTTLLLAATSFISFAQTSAIGPLKFLGIPIDGSESQMISQLKAKGFTYNSVGEYLSGQFNGRSVNVYIHTNHSLVDRIYVSFPSTTEGDIRVEFNRLLDQFNKSDKYLDLDMNEPIPDSEDISYEIGANSKRYQATFTYIDMDKDPVEFTSALLDGFSGVISEDVLNGMKERFATKQDLTEEEQNNLSVTIAAELQQSLGDDEEKAIQFVLAYLSRMKELADGQVWFMIHENYGKYNIGLYYDNLHNRAHGEDL